MFTGIITDVGRLAAIDTGRDARALTVHTSYDVDTISVGASIAHAGVCLTVIDRGARAGSGAWHVAEASNETLSKTTLGGWDVGGAVNLERALAAGDELGGHIVSGHVDGLGEVTSLRPDAGSWRLRCVAPASLASAIAPKGSIAIDGVSLTVNAVDDLPDGRVEFGVNIIPHTWDATTLGALTAGAMVNLEIDMLARYVARAMATRGVLA